MHARFELGPDKVAPLERPPTSGQASAYWACAAACVGVYRDRTMPVMTQPSLRALSPDDPRVVAPLATIREAATYLGVGVSTFHSWARGYERRRGEGRVTVAPSMVSALPAAGAGRAVPVIGLAEGYVLQAFRLAGVPLQRIRPALGRLAREIGVPHALASRHLYTDGCEVLYHYAAHAGDDVVRSLTVVRSGQNVFPEIVDQYLSRVTWDAEDWPWLLHLPAFHHATVVVDMKRAFGRPMLEHGGARVEDIGDRFRGGDGLEAIAVDFGVPLEECEDVVRVAIAARPAA